MTVLNYNDRPNKLLTHFWKWIKDNDLVKISLICIGMYSI